MNIYLALGSLLIIVLSTPYIIKRLKHRSLYPLFPKSINFGKRQNTFRQAFQLMEARGAKVLVETGVARAGLKNAKSDGASTIVFGSWCKNNHGKLYSVDISSENVTVANEAIQNEGLSDFVNTSVDDSVHFLQSFEHKIDFLYLDSYDYDKHNKSEQYNCQVHHLNEFKAAENKLHDNSIVLIDDCRLKGGGKGKLVLKYMEDNGWKRVISTYQVLLVRRN